MLNVLVSIGLLGVILATLLPTFTWTARMERASTERIQALWAAHGLLEELRMVANPGETGRVLRWPLEGFRAFREAEIRWEPGPAAGLLELEVAIAWTTLQGMPVRVALRELVPAAGVSR